MDFEKSVTFKLPRIGADEEALRSVEAVLSQSGPCVYRYYQDTFDSLDELLAGRKLPLNRIELDAPAATVCIESSGVIIHQRPEARDVVRDLQATLLKHEITPLARKADFYGLLLMVVFLGAWLRNGYSVMAITFVVGTLLEHAAKPGIVTKPVVKLPFGMQVDQRIWLVGGLVALFLVTLAKSYLGQGE